MPTYTPDIHQQAHRAWVERRPNRYGSALRGAYIDGHTEGFDAGYAKALADMNGTPND